MYRYNNRDFNTEREARWAALFDGLGINYEQAEDPNYDTTFYLPDMHIHVEILGDDVDEQTKADLESWLENLIGLDQSIGHPSNDSAVLAIAEPWSGNSGEAFGTLMVDGAKPRLTTSRDHLKGFFCIMGGKPVFGVQGCSRKMHFGGCFVDTVTMFNTITPEDKHLWQIATTMAQNAEVEDLSAPKVEKKPEISTPEPSQRHTDDEQFTTTPFGPLNEGFVDKLDAKAPALPPKQDPFDNVDVDTEDFCFNPSVIAIPKTDDFVVSNDGSINADRNVIGEARKFHDDIKAISKAFDNFIDGKQTEEKNESSSSPIPSFDNRSKMAELKSRTEGAPVKLGDLLDKEKQEEFSSLIPTIKDEPDEFVDLATEDQKNNPKHTSNKIGKHGRSSNGNDRKTQKLSEKIAREAGCDLKECHSKFGERDDDPTSTKWTKRGDSATKINSVRSEGVPKEEWTHPSTPLPTLPKEEKVDKEQEVTQTVKAKRNVKDLMMEKAIVSGTKNVRSGIAIRALFEPDDVLGISTHSSTENRTRKNKEVAQDASSDASKIVNETFVKSCEIDRKGGGTEMSVMNFSNPSDSTTEVAQNWISLFLIPDESIDLDLDFSGVCQACYNITGVDVPTQVMIQSLFNASVPIQKYHGDVKLGISKQSPIFTLRVPLLYKPSPSAWNTRELAEGEMKKFGK